MDALKVPSVVYRSYICLQHASSSQLLHILRSYELISKIVMTFHTPHIACTVLHCRLLTCGLLICNRVHNMWHLALTLLALALMFLMMQLHHSVMTNAMKAKQSIDVAQCDALEHAVEHFAKMYTKHE